MMREYQTYYFNVPARRFENINGHWYIEIDGQSFPLSRRLMEEYLKRLDTLREKAWQIYTEIEWQEVAIKEE